MPARKRGWVFTVNNYTEADEKWFLDLDLVEERIRYIKVGREVGEAGTPHLQGYIEFTGVTSFARAKAVCRGGHIEPRMGSPAQAQDYCGKEDPEPIERGNPLVVPGTRTDLIEATTLIREGQPIDVVAERLPTTYVKYTRGLQALHTMNAKHRTEAPEVFWLWGATGVGKTRTAVEYGGSHYIKDETKWWDGYDQQAVIIIDDFDGKWPFRNFLRLLDRYEYQAEIKGGTVKINSPSIFITCEFPPEQWWEGTQLRQVLRRIKRVTHME